MWQFLQTYGAWIIAGLFILLMLRMHAGGMVHGTEHGGHEQSTAPPADQPEPGSKEPGAGTPVGAKPGTPDGARRGCCG